MITTGDDDLADRLGFLTEPGNASPLPVRGGWSQLPRDQPRCRRRATPQLARLDEISSRQTKRREFLRACLAGTPGLALPPSPSPSDAGLSPVHRAHTVAIPGLPRRLRPRTEFARRRLWVYYPRVVFDYDCYRRDPRVMVAEVPHATRIASESQPPGAPVSHISPGREHRRVATSSVRKSATRAAHIRITS